MQAMPDSSCAQHRCMACEQMSRRDVLHASTCFAGHSGTMRRVFAALLQASRDQAVTEHGCASLAAGQVGGAPVVWQSLPARQDRNACRHPGLLQGAAADWSAGAGHPQPGWTPILLGLADCLNECPGHTRILRSLCSGYASRRHSSAAEPKLAACFLHRSVGPGQGVPVRR